MCDKALLLEIKQFRNEAFLSLPVRDDTRTAHFALQEILMTVNRALNKVNESDDASN